jgi:hypothetical protein
MVCYPHDTIHECAKHAQPKTSVFIEDIDKTPAIWPCSLILCLDFVAPGWLVGVPRRYPFCCDVDFDCVPPPDLLLEELLWKIAQPLSVSFCIMGRMQENCMKTILLCSALRTTDRVHRLAWHLTDKQQLPSRSSKDYQQFLSRSSSCASSSGTTIMSWTCQRVATVSSLY